MVRVHWRRSARVEAWIVSSHNTVPMSAEDRVGEESCFLTHADDPIASSISRVFGLSAAPAQYPPESTLEYPFVWGKQY